MADYSPKFIQDITITYANGEKVTYKGFGNAQVKPNMVPLNDRHVTPQPHDWMEVHVMLHIEEEEKA